MATIEYSFSWLRHTWDAIGQPRWIIIASIFLYAVYKISTRNFGVFKSIGVNGPRAWPVIGSMWPFIQMGTLDHDLRMKQVYGSVVGTFLGSTPTLLIYDLEILKALLVKDFAYFQNRNPILPLDFPLQKMLLWLKDDHWKFVRNTLTPTFSSGKLRKICEIKMLCLAYRQTAVEETIQQMEQQLNKCAETLLTNLQQKANENKAFDLHEYCAAYTLDVIASSTFGLQIDSHNDPNNQFVRMSNVAMNAMRLKTFIGILYFFFPSLSKPLGKLGFQIIPKHVIDFFVETIDKALEDRRETISGKVKTGTDFLQLMVNVEQSEDNTKDEDLAPFVGTKMSEDCTNDWKRNTQSMTHEEVLAQSIIFLLAGFDTTSNTLSFLGYLLAVNSDCQEKLFAEIDSVMEGQDHVTLDLVNKMPYLDMCLSETLRLYPPLPRIDRVTGEDYIFSGHGLGLPKGIPKGMVINIPVYALHYDPEHWNEPAKFNPDRFTPEAKASRNPYCYLPFGIGPRHCIGMRLALLGMKIAMVYTLRKFRIVVCDETQIPLITDKHQVRSIQGVKLRVVSRDN